MNENIHAVIQAVFKDSNNGSIHFGEVIGQLMDIEVESYFVDSRSGRTTYFLPDGETLEFSFEKPALGIANAFDASAVRAAIVGAQQGKVMYPEFKLRSQAAGCISYMVWIAGRHVVYYGRKGETHIEHFPN